MKMLPKTTTVRMKATSWRMPALVAENEHESHLKVVVSILFNVFRFHQISMLQIASELLFQGESRA